MTLKEIQQERITWAECDAKRDHDLTEPEGIEAFRDITYRSDSITAHLLDVYCPKNAPVGLPVIISIHGGGWFYGDKELYRFYCMHLAQMGFVVVNCNYRLMPEDPYPAAIEDVCHVVCWTLAHRKDYTTPDAPWFMVGDSAGAQLVSQYCILAAEPVYRHQLDFETYDQLPSAVALNCGIYDMAMTEDVHRNLYVQETTGKQLELFEQVLSYMNSAFPPTYLMASVNDELYPCTLPMKARLETCGIPFVFAEYGEGVPEDGHVFHLNLYSENGMRCNQEEAAFFKKIAAQSKS
ncbi:alpha/beta hydrolase [Ruminococcus sp.]|uniref:alpha/beta hydrolase n=1 Tax=Ruminococcus sp. TaxID=41978 RepID=UPI0025D1C6B0|nr:alpha/beta hydrolase [Ruminococcus sp.]